MIENAQIHSKLFAIEALLTISARGKTIVTKGKFQIRLCQHKVPQMMIQYADSIVAPTIDDSSLFPSSWNFLCLMWGPHYFAIHNTWEDLKVRMVLINMQALPCIGSDGSVNVIRHLNGLDFH